MPVAVMKKAMQLVKHQHGMPRERAFCEHKWEPLFAHPVTLEMKERHCKMCGLRQRSEIVWCDVKEA
jgi:hypothetical protein